MSQLRFSLLHRKLSTLALGLLSAVGTTSLTALPTAAQTLSAEAISPFCETFREPWTGEPDLVKLSEAMALGGDLNQPCEFYGERMLPLNFWLSTDPQTAQRLIEMGVDVNARDGRGDTPLHYVGDSVENARSLIERGANVNARNDSGLTPLHNVFGRKSAAVMALLIEQGADVNAATLEGMTPLHFASFSPTSEIAALLISKGADVNARTAANFTPLHYVSSRPDVAALLLQAGADPTIQNNEGGAIHLSDISPEVLQLLLAAGVDVNARNQAGQTALHKQRFDAENVAVLLSAGADVNLQDNQGRTPLFDVNIKVAEQLVTAGADVNIQDELGRTPLHQAVIEEQSYFGLELVPLFLDEGAIADIEDYQGETALDIARRLGKTNIAMLFPSDSATLVDAETTGAETTDSETTDAQQLVNIQRQVEDLLQAARADSRSVKKAVSRLSQAAELARTVSDVKSRDRLLRDIGFVLVELDALENAEAIAQLMNYETFSPRTGAKLRAQLEQIVIQAYIQSDRAALGLAIAENAPQIVRAQYLESAVVALIKQDLRVEAIALVDRFSDDSYSSFHRQRAIRLINQSYIENEQFEAALTFWQQQSFDLIDEEASGLRDIAIWAGRLGQLEKARAIANQIPESSRAGTLLDLARLYQYQDQLTSAKSLLDEARLLLKDDRQGWFELMTEIAVAYADIGQPEIARKMVVDAEQSDSSGVFYSVGDWVNAFARVGAFDRAMNLIDTASAAPRNEARLSLASAYVDRRQYDPAITILSQIPSSALTPYLAERQELFDRIVEETLEQEKVSTAKRAVQVIENPLDSVPVWMKIASFYQEKQQPQAAIDVLDSTLALVMPLERLSSPVDFNVDYEVSNASLLVAIAQEYWQVGQREKAIETAESAIAAIQTFQSDTQSSVYGDDDLEAIAKLGRDWQVLELQSAAVRELASRINPATADERLFSNQYYQLTSLSKLAYNPGQPDTDVLNRSLAQLEEILEQTTAPQRLSVLHNLAVVYSEVGRTEKARATIEEMLTLIAPLAAEEQGRNYSRLATITLQNVDLEASLQILPRLSNAQQIAVLTPLVYQSAQADDTVQTMRYFEQLMAVSERSQNPGDRDSLLLDLSHEFSGLVSGEIYSQGPRNPAEVALMMRLPQSMSGVKTRAIAWMSFAPNLPPAETAQAYKALSATMKEMPTSYDKRNFLWLWMEEALSHGAFEQATQIAYGLDGDYCRTALSWIETVKRQSDRNF